MNGMRGSNPNRIKEFRQAKGWTAQQLADAIGSSQGAVSRLENGKMKLSLPWLERIAFAIGVRVVDLLDHVGDFSYAYVIGSLKATEPPIWPPDMVQPIPVPSLHTFKDDDVLHAFAGDPASGGYIIVKPIAKLDRTLIGKEFIVLQDAKSVSAAHDRLSFLKLEESDTGPGFLRSDGDPAKRWLPWDHLSISARWLVVAEIKPVS
jgi:transcriptional regulator with XRE-family HTH domain